MSGRADAEQPRMVVLLAVPWDRVRGGVTAVTDTVAKYLLSRGHQVRLFHPSTSTFLKQSPTKLGYSGALLRLIMPFGSGLKGVLATIAFPLLSPVVLAQVFWFLRAQRIQLVNLHYPVGNYIYFAICRRLLPIRLITSVHGRDVFYKDRPLDKYPAALRFVINSSDLVVLPSDSYRLKFLEAFPNMRDRTICIHNAVDPTMFRPAACEPGTNGQNRYILCVAELQEYKAIDVLLHAAMPLLTSDPSLSLVLAGHGALREELETLAVTLGIRQRTMFLGNQGVSEIVWLLHGCEVLVLPSRMEPFGIAIIEGMACRKPVVASATGGILEIIEHNVNGILVERENAEALTAALQRVLANDDLRRTIAEHGYASVMARFRSSDQGAAYERAFAALLGLERLAPQSPANVPEDC